MINHQHLLRDAQGRIRCTTTGPVRNFGGGTPTRSGLLVIFVGVPTVFMGGLGYNKVTGAICSVQPLNVANGNLLADDDGNVRATNDPPAFWYCGLPFAANNMLSLAPVE